MDPERWRRIEPIIDRALDLPVEKRPAFVEQACDDAALRREIVSLLAEIENSEARSLLEQPAVQAFADLLPEEVDTDPFGLIGQTFTHYRIVEYLGGGGMGIVYRADDLQLRRTVALKFLSPVLMCEPGARQRFIVEAQAAAALDHTNICTVHEISETVEGRIFIAMAFYEGETIKEKMARGPLPIEEALDYAIQSAQGLSKAHTLGIVHRDVKPANVMVTREGVVKVLDFGLAKVMDLDLTRTGATLGTIAYMSPEQARGEAVDHRTDIWSLGVVLYQMIAGQPPFQGSYPQGLIYLILNKDPAPLTAVRPGVSGSLQCIVWKMLRKDPAERYQSMQELLVDLRHEGKRLRESPLARGKEEEHVRSRLRGYETTSRKRYVRIGSVGALVVLAVLVGYLLYAQFRAGGLISLDEAVRLNTMPSTEEASPLEGTSGGSMPANANTLAEGAESSFSQKSDLEALLTDTERIADGSHDARTDLQPSSSGAAPFAMAHLVLQAEPAGFIILNDQRRRPGAAQVEPGVHRVGCGEAPYRTDTTITVAANETKALTCYSHSQISVSVRLIEGHEMLPAGILINEEYVGTAPWTDADPRAAGAYRVEAQFLTSERYEVTGGTYISETSKGQEKRAREFFGSQFRVVVKPNFQGERHRVVFLARRK